MAVIRAGLVALVLVCATSCSQSLVSAGDQYEAHEDRPHPPRLFNEATDESLKIRKTHRFSFPVKKTPIKLEYERNEVVPELQVGCGEGFVEERTPAPKTRKLGFKSLLRERRGTEDSNRKARSYYPWSSNVIQTPAAISYTIWQPPLYQLKRPYFIPVWGENKRFPFFFPPQPILRNPGFPLDNPPRKYLPPNRGYLPVKTTTTAAPESPSVIRNRFGEEDSDRPVWGSNQKPQTTTQVVPTRRSKRPNEAATHPPLIHSAPEEIIPPALSSPEETIPSKVPKDQIDGVFTRPSTTTRRPESARQPSRCVWAIISCCSTDTSPVRQDCFEQLGCEGPVWGANPCESDFARAAINSALNYYNEK